MSCLATAALTSDADAALVTRVARTICLYGAAALGAALQSHLLSLTSANETFVRMMTDNALMVSPPRP